MDTAREIVTKAASVTQSIFTQFLALASGQKSGVKFRGVVKKITRERVVFDDESEDEELPDHIIVCTGYP